MVMIFPVVVSVSPCEILKKRFGETYYVGMGWGSYLISFQKASVIHGIGTVDIWRRAIGNTIVQTTQQTVSKTCIDTYTNFKQLTLSKDGTSHSLHLLNAAYSDPVFTSVDPMVIVKLDISNTFGSLCARLVLDVLSGKSSRDYVCDIKVDEEF